MGTDDKCIDILQLEYSQVYSKLLYLDGQANNYVNIILTAIAALAAFLAFFIEDEKITDLIPFSILICDGSLIIGLLIIMSLHNTVQCFRLGGYIRYLETRINQAINSELLKWESTAASKYVHNDITSRFISIIIGLIFLIMLLSAGYVSAVHIFPKWPLVAVMVYAFIIIEIIAFFVYLDKSRTVHEKMYRLFEQQWQSKHQKKVEE